jgi:hypothetical protein
MPVLRSRLMICYASSTECSMKRILMTKSFFMGCRCRGKHVEAARLPGETVRWIRL